MTDILDTKQLRSLQAATQRSFIAVDRHLNSSSNDFSLAALILSQMPERDHAIYNERALAETIELSNLARESSGGAVANGTWIPFQALSRDLTTANSGGNLKTSGVDSSLAPGLLPSSAILGAGATVLTGIQRASLALPRVDVGLDASGVAWIGEGAAGPQREPSFGVRVIEPKTVSIQMLVSRRLLLNSSVSVEQELRREVLRRFTAEIDKVLMTGDGNLQPLGLFNDSAIEVLSVGANGGAPTWAHLVEAESVVADRTGQMTAPAFVMSNVLRKKLRTTQRGTGLDYILTGDTLFGKPVRASALVPKNLTKGSGVNLSAMIYGDMAEIVVGFWGPAAIDLVVNPYTYAKDQKVELVARAEVGFTARTPGAITTYKDFVTT